MKLDLTKTHRRCPDCYELKELNEQNFYVQGKSTGKPRFDYPCKKCRITRSLKTQGRYDPDAAEIKPEPEPEPKQAGRPRKGNHTEFDAHPSKFTLLEKAWRGML